MRFGPLASESESYRKAREELLDAAIALRDQRERVAELPRILPLDTAVKHYLFQERPAALEQDGPINDVRLSEFFTSPAEPIVVHHSIVSGAQTHQSAM